MTQSLSLCVQSGGTHTQTCSCFMYTEMSELPLSLTCHFQASLFMNGVFPLFLDDSDVR